jgi:hypothetical protein
MQSKLFIYLLVLSALFTTAFSMRYASLSNHGDDYSTTGTYYGTVAKYCGKLKSFGLKILSELNNPIFGNSPASKYFITIHACYSLYKCFAKSMYAVLFLSGVLTVFFSNKEFYPISDHGSKTVRMIDWFNFFTITSRLYWVVLAFNEDLGLVHSKEFDPEDFSIVCSLFILGIFVVNVSMLLYYGLPSDPKAYIHTESGYLLALYVIVTLFYCYFSSPTKESISNQAS